MDRKSFKLFDIDQYRLLIRNVHLADCMISDTVDLPIELEENKTRLEDSTISDKLVCSFCNTTFKDRIEQRAHYKLDWHRFNLKQKLAGLKSINQEKFSQLAENDNDDLSSISGSESSSDEETESSETEPISKTTNHQPMKHMKVFFQNSDGIVFSVYRCLLHHKKQPPEKDEDLSKLALALAWKINWAVIMLTGGHFAAAIFQGSDSILHKTFHSYTVRAGRGTSQSTRDQRSGGGAKSAGSSLRRYNENCLNQRVQELLNSWKPHLSTCSIILIRASGASSKMLFQGKEAPLDRNDSRIRIIPIPTRRATYKEVQRIHSTISSIQIYGPAENLEKNFPKLTKSSSFKTKDNNSNESSPRGKSKYDRGKERKSLERVLPDIINKLAAKSTTSEEDEEIDQRMIEIDFEISFKDELQPFDDDIPKKDSNKNNQKIKKKKNKIEQKKEDKENKEKPNTNSNNGDTSILNSVDKQLYKNLIEICKLNDLDSLNEFFNTNDDLIKIVNHQDSDGSTALHLVAQLGKDNFITVLMSNGADPALSNKDGKPPYAVAANKSVRYAFRRFQAAEPERYGYNKAQIPGPLTPEMEQAMTDKAKEQRRIKKKKERQKEKQLKEENDKERFLRLSDREKCALAAERRVMALASRGGGAAAHLVQSRCFQCGVDITGKVPFEYGANRFCTMDCLKKHRKTCAAASTAN